MLKRKCIELSCLGYMHIEFRSVQVSPWMYFWFVSQWCYCGCLCMVVLCHPAVSTSRPPHSRVPQRGPDTKTTAVTPLPLEMSLVLLDISAAVIHKHGKGQTPSLCVSIKRLETQLWRPTALSVTLGYPFNKQSRSVLFFWHWISFSISINIMIVALVIKTINIAGGK